MGLKISIKKPFGGKNSFVRRTFKNPAGLAFGGVMGAALNDFRKNAQSKSAEYQRQQEGLAAQELANQDEMTRLAAEEEAKRKALGERQRGQILGFADETQARANDFRTGLARSLSDSGQAFFNRLNPAILEDLNSRGLFTSQTARDQEQTQALKDIELENQNSLRRFDTDIFNTVNDIRGTGLSALLGGEQSALDSALELRKAGIQRRFDESDASREQAFAGMLAKRQSRDNLISSLLGLGGRLGAGYLGMA